MAGPTPNAVHVDSTQTTNTKPKPKLSNQQLAAILQRIATLMAAEGDNPSSNPQEANPEADSKLPKVAPKSDTQKPYPTEHAARQHDPKDYSEIRRKNDAFGPGISVIYGIKNGQTEVQSLRFAADKFTVAQAKKWLTEHKYSIGSLEAATGDTTKTAKENLVKQANIADLLVSIIHREFTETADGLFGGGQLTQAERITLSSAIGDALDVFNARIDKDLLDLRTRATYSDAPSIAMGKGDGLDSEVTIFAKADEQQIAYGVSYPAKPLGWSDTQGDWVSPPQIERMAHNYLLKSRQYDINHARLASYDEAQIVESYIAPTDFTLNGHAVTKGSWVVATYFPKPEVWAAVKAGQINAYSIKGRGKRTPLTAQTS